MRYHSILLHTERNLGMEILKYADEKKMLGENFRWFFTDDITEGLLETNSQYLEKRNMLLTQPVGGQGEYFEQVKKLLDFKNFSLYKQRTLDAITMALHIAARGQIRPYEAFDGCAGKLGFTKTGGPLLPTYRKLFTKIKYRDVKKFLNLKKFCIEFSTSILNIDGCMIST